ncbi:hypothetical protein EZV73_25410 [Acidaminobacter sp. JC074]|uniref:hypothetical protein n=1 Tax=Acidaminobacter sp. JC074 TaxID=2530199 RepID=UPI001F0F7323|nr:hypothetical protein [Acidaminobacter sp. JC074]MCH4890943.1 hypothetical protein [Acidaminobacter sp. JC074]
MNNKRQYILIGVSLSVILLVYMIVNQITNLNEKVDALNRINEENSSKNVVQSWNDYMLRQEVSTLSNRNHELSQQLEKLENDYNDLLDSLKYTDNFISKDGVIFKNDKMLYGDKAFDLIYNLKDQKVYYKMDCFGMVEYSDGVYILKDEALDSNISSRPLISPDKKRLVYLGPFEEGLNTNVYIYHIYERENKKIIQSDLYYNKRVKVVRWLDDDNLILIVGSVNDTWSRDDYLYHYNLKENQMNYLAGYLEDHIEVSNFIIRDQGIEYEISTWNKDLTDYTISIELLSYDKIPGYERQTLDNDFPENPIDIMIENQMVEKKEFKRLIKDEEAYKIGDDFRLGLRDSKTLINFPYASFNRGVYDLEREQIVFDISSIEEALSDVWGKTVAKDGYLWYSDVYMKPENLNFLSGFNYHDERNEIVFSIESFLADAMDTLVGSYNLKSKAFKFVESPFYGSVGEIVALEGTHYAAYSFYTGGDESTCYVDVIDLDKMKVINHLNVDKIYNAQEVWITDMKWTENNLVLTVEVNGEETSDEFIIWSK